MLLKSAPSFRCSETLLHFKLKIQIINKKIFPLGFISLKRDTCNAWKFIFTYHCDKLSNHIYIYKLHIIIYINFQITYIYIYFHWLSFKIKTRFCKNVFLCKVAKFHTLSSVQTLYHHKTTLVRHFISLFLWRKELVKKNREVAILCILQSISS